MRLLRRPYVLQRRNLRIRAALVASVAALFTMSGPAFLGPRNLEAANAAWNVDADGNWADGVNWNPAAAPGVSGGVTRNNIEIATFGLPLTANRIITVDLSRNIGGITFSNTSAFGYTISGGSILLTNGGTIQMTGGIGKHTDTVNTNVEIQGDGGSATFSSTTSTTSNLFTDRLLAFTGFQITGVSTSGKTTTLTLTGTSTQANVVNSIIGNGSSGGKLAISKTGTGTWRLGGTNTFTGGVTVLEGTLSLGNNAALGGSGSSLTINGGNLNAYSSTTIANGVPLNFLTDFAFGGTSSLNTGTGAINLNGVRTITTNGSNGLTLAGNITGADGIIKNGTSTLILAGANTFTGGVVVNAGRLQITNATALGATASSLTLNAGTLVTSTAFTIPNGNAINLNGNFSFTNSSTNPANKILNLGTGAVTLTTPVTVNCTNIDSVLTLDGVISGGTYNALDLSLNGLGNLTLSNTGTVNVRPGGQTVSSDGGPSGGTLTIAAPLNTGTQTLTNSGSGYIALTGPLTGSGALVRTGTGFTTLSGNNAGYTGNIAVNSGTLIYGNTAASPTTLTTVAAGASLGLQVGAGLYSTADIDNLFANTMTNVSMNATSLVGIDTTPGAVSYNSAITGTRGLEKLGANTLTLGGATNNTSTNKTFVYKGVLTLAKTGGATAVGGDLLLQGGSVALTAGTQNQIADTANVTVTTGTLNGNSTSLNAGAVAIGETVANLTLNNAGRFATGADANGWNITGAFNMTGGSGAAFMTSGGGQIRVGSLSLTNVTAEPRNTVETYNSFIVYGDSTVRKSMLLVGAGGLALNGSNLLLRRGSFGHLGSKLVLDGDVTTSGNSPSYIYDELGSIFNTVSVELGSGTGSVQRKFSPAAGEANLTINIPITNGNNGASIGTLVKEGPGALYLNPTGGTNNPANTYTGGTIVNNGWLSYIRTVAKPAVGTTTVNAAGGISLGIGNGGFTITDFETLRNTGALGTGDGSIVLDPAAGVGIDTSIPSGSFTYTGTLTGSRPFAKMGETNWLTLGGTSPNTNTGLTSVYGGTLVLDKTSATDHAINGDVIVHSGTLQLTARASDAIPDTANVTILNGALSGYSVQETIGSLTMAGNSDFSIGKFGTGWTINGAFNITGTNGAQFSIFSGGQLSANSLSLTDMTAQPGNSNSTPNSFVLYGYGTTKASLFVGAGGLSLNNSILSLRLGTDTDVGSRLVLEGNTTTTGTAPSFIIPDNTGSTILNAGTNTIELSSAPGTYTRTITTGATAPLTIGVSIVNSAAGISGVTAGITKDGPGTLTLTAANSYTGTTTISAGTLALSGAGTLGTGNVIVNGTLSVVGITPVSYTFAATQTVSGSGTILATGKPVTIAGILSPGNSPGTLNVTGNLALTSTTDSLFEITGPGLGNVDLLNVSGNLTYGGDLFIANNQAAGSFNLFDFASLTAGSDFSSIILTGFYTGTLTPSGLNDNQWSGILGGANVAFNGTTGVLSVSVIPEPSTLVLGGLAMLGLGVHRLRRRKMA